MLRTKSQQEKAVIGTSGPRRCSPVRSLTRCSTRSATVSAKTGCRRPHHVSRTGRSAPDMPADRVIRWSTARAMMGVAAIAAVVSYEHATDLPTPMTPTNAHEGSESRKSRCPCVSRSRGWLRLFGKRVPHPPSTSRYIARRSEARMLIRTGPALPSTASSPGRTGSRAGVDAAVPTQSFLRLRGVHQQLRRRCHGPRSVPASPRRSLAALARARRVRAGLDAATSPDAP
jgi:hypothetical protein